MSLKIYNENVSSIFRLIGNNENALTYALGYVFSKDSDFLIRFLKTTGVIESKQGVRYDKYFEKPLVSLQKYNDDKSGIKDILIESEDYRIVIEAKTDNSFPTEAQILKYANINLNADWLNFSNKNLLILTRKNLNKFHYKETINKLSSFRIKVVFSTWLEVFSLIRKNLYERANSNKEFLIKELATFLSDDYKMDLIEQEVIYRKVLKDHYYKVCNRDGNGYYFDGGRQKFVYPACQFFLPCYGPARTSTKTGEFIRKIKSYERLTYEEIINNQDKEMVSAFKYYLGDFSETPNDRVIFHVFTLGKKIPIHESKVNFKGSEKGYTDLENVLTE